MAAPRDAEPSRSAHVDTFAREHLPPPEQWPRLHFDLPELRYPARLNCAAELLAGPPDDRPAFRTADGETWSYGLLRDRVDRIAHTLTGELGVVPGNRVLLRGPTTPWLAACWLAVLKAGAVAVTVLAQQRPHELAAICEIARVDTPCATRGPSTTWPRRRSPGSGSLPTAGTRPATCWPARPRRRPARRTRPSRPRPTTWR
ncbi:hypothetical protein SPARM206S_01878 [Streptomyces parvulus]